MRRFATAVPAEPQPFSTMNTTPLIDVLLVLLIMFIITIPMQTHKVAIDLPQAGPATGAPPVTHRLDLAADGSLSFDGVATSDAALPGALAAMRKDPDALLLMQTDGEARYERFDSTLAAVKRAGVTKLGFVGNGAFAR
ncbi:MAG: biopolymer transporter ExbD [Sphingomonas sp. SCN 67-18]|uniref:ExbD/TolR family protein n=1 Tax=uncultured Sphingomonas sp. TaxID=158754 RepID=UPI00086E9B60|nr:biopolymer transporter ExbD [Sphingomonas sp. SCN 67-18]ODU20453.1 MAG: biopolymer transporter ExbD [Sphingomonas sp. SCN 67-18]